jgi:hypothetical protein
MNAMRSFLMVAAAVGISLAIASPGSARHHKLKPRLHPHIAQPHAVSKDRLDQPDRNGFAAPSRENEPIQDSWTRLSPCCPP